MFIGELAKRTGVAPSALRYYESLGLVASHRSPGGQRLYQAEAVEAVGFIRSGRALGFSMREIAALLFEGEQPFYNRWQEVSRRRLTELDLLQEKIDRLRSIIALGAGCRCQTARVCPLLNQEPYV